MAPAPEYFKIKIRINLLITERPKYVAYYSGRDFCCNDAFVTSNEFLNTRNDSDLKNYWSLNSVWHTLSRFVWRVTPTTVYGNNTIFITTTFVADSRIIGNILIIIRFFFFFITNCIIRRCSNFQRIRSFFHFFPQCFVRTALD